MVWGSSCGSELTCPQNKTQVDGMGLQLWVRADQRAEGRVYWILQGFAQQRLIYNTTLKNSYWAIRHTVPSVHIIVKIWTTCVRNCTGNFQYRTSRGFSRPCCFWIPAVADVPGVAGVLDALSVLADPGTLSHLVSLHTVLYNEKCYIDYGYRTIEISNIELTNSRNHRTVRYRISRTIWYRTHKKLSAAQPCFSKDLFYFELFI